MMPIARPTRIPRRVKFWGSEALAARMLAGVEALLSSDSSWDGDGGIRGVVSPLSGAIVEYRLRRGLGGEV